MTDLRKLFDNFLFKVMTTWLFQYIITEPLAKVAEAMSHIPNGLTPMSESDWAETTPTDQHIYMVFPDEQVTSES